MRRYLLGLTVVFASAVSTSAYAQVDQIMTSHPCTGSTPSDSEVYIYTEPNFGGTCAALYQGFYPNPANLTGGFGLPNDSISSIKMGFGLRVRLFEHVVYGGFYQMYSVAQVASLASFGFDNRTTSIRVENNNRSWNCDDLRPGEFALFRDANFVNDCVVLYYGHNYPQPINMGIANDSVSSVRGGPAFPANCGGVQGSWVMTLYSNGGFGGSSTLISSGQNKTYLSTFNDVTSSVTTWAFCVG